MRHFIMLAFVFVLAATASAQNDKYLKAMEGKVVALDTTHSQAGLAELTNAFIRIADAEKTQWLPYYYAALTNTMSGMMAMNPQGGSSVNVDQLADKSQELLDKAAGLLGKEHSEIYVVRKLIATMRMMVDPQSRYMQYGPQAAEALAKAKQLDPENPRVYLLEGQDKFYTPEQFGGSKSEAQVLFQKALDKFAAAKPESKIAPSWGKNSATYLMGLSKQ